MSMSEPERGKTESDGMAGLAIAVTTTFLCLFIVSLTFNLTW